jgi:hypothetical protein
VVPYSFYLKRHQGIPNHFLECGCAIVYDFLHRLGASYAAIDHHFLTAKLSVLNTRK